jgi:hypothetical protein
MASEMASQHSIAGTALDFEILALEYLTESFFTGRPAALAKRQDAQKGTHSEEQDGDYYFDFDKIENLKEITYVQGLIALQQAVPSELRLKYKQLHAQGATPWEAYSQVIAEWEKMRGPLADEETPAASGDGARITDRSARQLLKGAPAELRRDYDAKRKAGASPAEALECVLKKWRGQQG